MKMKRKTEYADEDLISIARGEKTREEVAQKYGVTVASIRMAMSRRGLFIHKTPVLARYNGRTEQFVSMTQCAKRLGVSQPTIKKALNGLPTILDELEIEVEVYYGEEELYD